MSFPGNLKRQTLIHICGSQTRLFQIVLNALTGSYTGALNCFQTLSCCYLWHIDIILQHEDATLLLPYLQHKISGRKIIMQEVQTTSCHRCVAYICSSASETFAQGFDFPWAVDEWFCEFALVSSPP